MKISPFTPLFFSPSSDASGLQSDFVQTWLSSDRIYVQVICDEDETAPSLVVNDCVADTSTTMSWRSWENVNGKKIYYQYLQNMSDGYYTLSIGDQESELFRVTDDESEVKDTVLIQFCSRDNRQRQDVIFWIAGLQTFFSWRVPGGFRDDNWQFSVDNEQYVTQQQDIYELYAYESTQKSLTVGFNTGVPVWYGEFLNRVLCCTYFYVNGVRYTRKDSSVPEKQQLADGLRLYVFAQMLQEVQHGNVLVETANQVALRYVNDGDANTNARVANTTIHPTVDGEQITVVNPTIVVDDNV